MFSFATPGAILLSVWLLALVLIGIGVVLQHSEAAGPRGCTGMDVQSRRICGGTLLIENRGRIDAVRNPFGSKPIATGDEEFDRDFVVHAAPKKYATWLFAPSRRADVVATLRRLSPYGDVRVRVSVGELHLQVGRCPSDARLGEIGQALVRHLTTTPMASLPLTGRCPVCATELCEPVWRCDRCLVPQHRDCRDYVGRCAVYACEPARRSA